MRLPTFRPIPIEGRQDDARRVTPFSQSRPAYLAKDRRTGTHLE